MSIVASWKNPNLNPSQESVKQDADETKRFVIYREKDEAEKAKVFTRQARIDNTHEIAIPPWAKQPKE